MADKVVKTEAEWKRQLTAGQFEVARKKGTTQNTRSFPLSLGIPILKHSQLLSQS